MMGETKMRWSKERIRDWYNARPWMRGCNYMSADCANRVDQWQELGFEETSQYITKSQQRIYIIRNTTTSAGLSNYSTFR